MSDHPIISIVEDDQEIRESLKMLIDSIGLNAKGFASAEEFLDSGSLSDSICLILDVQLPVDRFGQLDPGQHRLGANKLNLCE